MEIAFEAECWPLREPFSFAGFRVESLDAVHVTVSDGAHRGQGEGVVPVVFDITLQQTLALLAAARRAIGAGTAPRAACAALPPGPARNALDCALWDLEAKASGGSVWDLAGVGPAPAALQIDQSIGLGPPEGMAAAARASQHAVLKIKLDGSSVRERLAAIRTERPDATLIVDVNQAWSAAELERYAPVLADFGVRMVEQPLPVGADAALKDLALPVPVYADESCHTRADLARLAPLYDGINIKLDKTGGLTEALALAAGARQQGLGLMVGCMAGTSLSMAPAYVIATLCNWADLDGPLLLAQDRPASMVYAGGRLHCFSPALWG